MTGMGHLLYNRSMNETTTNNFRKDLIGILENAQRLIREYQRTYFLTPEEKEVFDNAVHWNLQSIYQISASLGPWCEDCNGPLLTDEEKGVRECPFSAEIYAESVMVQLCDRCYQISADDI